MHSDETVGWLAVAKGKNVMGKLTYEAGITSGVGGEGNTETSVSGYKQMSFSQTFSRYAMASVLHGILLRPLFCLEVGCQSYHELSVGGISL